MGGEKDAPHRWHRMGQCPLVSGLMVTEEQEEAGAAGKQMGREEGEWGGRGGRKVGGGCSTRVFSPCEIWAFGLKHWVSTWVHAGVTCQVLKMPRSRPCPQTF